MVIVVRNLISSYESNLFGQCVKKDSIVRPTWSHLNRPSRFDQLQDLPLHFFYNDEICKNYKGNYVIFCINIKIKCEETSNNNTTLIFTLL